VHPRTVHDGQHIAARRPGVGRWIDHRLTRRRAKGSARAPPSVRKDHPGSRSRGRSASMMSPSRSGRSATCRRMPSLPRLAGSAPGNAFQVASLFHDFVIPTVVRRQDARSGDTSGDTTRNTREDPAMRFPQPDGFLGVSGEPCRTVRGEGNQRLALANRRNLPFDLIGLFEPLANRFRGLRNRKAADWAGTRVNGQIEKFARNGYQIAGVIAIAGGADV